MEKEDKQNSQEIIVEQQTMTIVERNAQRWPELANDTDNTQAITDWAKHTKRTVEIEYVDYVGSRVQGVLDVSDETNSLFPSDASYRPLLEKA